MLIIFMWNQWDCLQRFVPASQIVKSAYYSDVLWWFHKNVQKLHSELLWHKNWLLLHNNAPSLTSFSPWNSCPKTTWLPSPTHTTHLAPATLLSFLDLR
jgi:hypothetical protein